MRNGTFIIPRTGERSRRQFSLRASSSLSPHDGSADRAAAEPESLRERVQAIAHNARARALAAWRWLNSDDGRGVLKCTLAYLLGSIATFWPPLSNWLGHRDGKHIVATLTVYFHPARTVGSMLEAILISIIAVAYAEIIAVLSMAVSIGSRHHLGLVAPAHAVVLIVSVGGGLGFIGWVKQRMNQPLVNVSSTLASMAIISVITKEESIQDGYFSGDKSVQVLKMLLLAISITVAVNLLLWRVSARRILRDSVLVASVSLGDKISFIAGGFLNGTEDEINSPEYAQVTKQYDSANAQMTASLREAKFEHYLLGHEKIYQLDKRLVKSLEALYQAIGGLRSALNTQFTLLKEVPANTESSDAGPSATSPDPSKLTRSMSAFLDGAKGRLSIIDESIEDEEHVVRPGTLLQSRSDPSLDKSPMFRAPSDIFALFIELLGPSLKSLVFTLSETLREPPFGANPETDITNNDQLRESLRDALALYNHARANALKEVYKSIELGRTRSDKIKADIEEVAAACGHFSFSLLAVAEDLEAYLDVLEDLKYEVGAGHRSWHWMKPGELWKPKRTGQDASPVDAERGALLPRPPARGLNGSATFKPIPDTIVNRWDSFSWDAAPEASKIMRQASKLVLKTMRFIAREDVLFGIKVGIGAILWAMFAFIPGTRPVYQHWRGEWGLLSYMVVVAMTTGASNTTSMSRFLGTIMGAACACISWPVSQGNPYALAAIGWLFSLWNFYLILVVKNGPMGRITLLAYNVIVLYAYSLSQNVDDDDDDEGGTNPLIFDIAYHRVVAVVLGIFWGMVVCRLLWPISARRKFQEGLSVLYLQLGLIWKRGPLGKLLELNNTTDYMREGEQAALQKYGKLLFLCALCIASC